MTNDGWDDITETQAKGLIIEHKVVDLDPGVNQIVFILGNDWRLLLHLGSGAWEVARRGATASL
jgi:hypothetical protein